MNNIETTVVNFLEEIVPKIEEYREKNINKYYAEKNSKDAEYQKMERYKNRVRVVDILLPSIQNALVNLGKLTIHEDTNNLSNIK